MRNHLVVLLHVRPVGVQRAVGVKGDELERVRRRVHLGRQEGQTGLNAQDMTSEGEEQVAKGPAIKVISESAEACTLGKT